MGQLAPEHEPEIDGTDEQLGGDLVVDVRAQVAAAHAARDHAGHLIAARLDHAGPEGITQGRVDRDLREQRAHDRAEGRLGQGPHGIGHGRKELRARVTGLRDRDVGRRELHEQLERERLLGRPAPVDGGLPDVGACRDVLQPQCGEALGDEELTGRVQDGAVKAVAARSAARCTPCLRGTPTGFARRTVLISQLHAVMIRYV